MTPRTIKREHLASFLADFRRYGNQTAIVHRDGLRHVRTSYKDVAALAGRFAAELEARDIRKGDRVLIWGENGPAWIAAFFGCLLRGVVAVPLDVAGSPEFARRVARDVSARLATGDCDHLGQLEHDVPHIAFETLSRTLPEQPLYEPASDLTEADPFQIIFTSGTTGDPKGVVHTHRNVLASLRPIEQQIQPYMMLERIFHPLRFIHTLPLSHVFGEFMGVWIPTLIAAEVHFEPRLVPGPIVDYIKRTRISVVAAVPRVLDLLRDHLRGRFPGIDERLAAEEGASEWRKWRVFWDVHRFFGLKFWAFIVGGATLPPDLEKFWSGLGFAVIQGYGMTETAALISLNHPFRRAQGSIGKVLPGREVKIREDGEILVRGETVSTATWEGGRLRQRESEWLETGDLAAVDPEGNLRYRGRKKDVIVTSAGLNIYPEDLEAALEAQSQVKASAVVQTEGRSGPEPFAALVVRNEAEGAEAVRAANRTLAEYQQIRRWMVWPDPDLPRTSTGKVLRREVARRVSGLQQSGNGAVHADALLAILSRISGQDASKLGDDASLADDVHLDSLARVELQSAIEMQWGLELDDAEWQQIRTIGDLRQRFRESGPATVPHEIKQPESEQRHIYPHWTLHWAQQLVRAAYIQTIMRFLVWFLAAPRVKRQIQRAPERPVLIVSNHITAYDVPLILYALPGRMRTRVAVSMAAHLLLDMRLARNQGSAFVDRVAPVGWFLITALHNVFPLPQHSGFRESFAFAATAMDRGYHVMVFPEGRRATELGLQHFRTGAGLLWKELRCDILPVYIEGLTEIKVLGGGWFRSGKLVVHVGDLVRFDPSLDPASATQVMKEAVERVSQS